MKRWYVVPIHLADQVQGHREHHWVEVGNGFALVAVHFHGPAEAAAFEANENVVPLGHLGHNKSLHPAIVGILAKHGVTAADGAREAVAKLVEKTKMHQLFLGEL